MTISPNQQNWIKVVRDTIIVALLGIMVHKGWNTLDRWIIHIEKPIVVNEPPKDTAKVKYIQPLTINNISYPKTVIQQLKADTIRRKEVEKSTIILGEQLKDGTLTEQKIDSAGKITESKQDVKATDQITIDQQGHVEVKEDKKAERKAKRKETWGKIKTGLVGGAIATVIILILMGK
jgi:hypothetical protein